MATLGNLRAPKVFFQEKLFSSASISAWIAFCCLLFPLSISANQESLAIKNGVLDLSTWDPVNDRKVIMDGEWLLAWASFIDPNAVPEFFRENSQSLTSPNTHWYQVPHTWNKTPTKTRMKGQRLGQGYATYISKVKGLDQSQANYALHIPYLSTSYEVFVVYGNEDVRVRSIASRGIPGINLYDNQPRTGRLTVAFPEDITGDFYLVIHLANYEHARGGLARGLELGRRDVLFFWRDMTLTLDIFILGALFIIMLNSFLVYTNERNDPGGLFLGIFTLMIVARILATQNLIENFSTLPDATNYIISSKISYITSLCSIAPMLAYYRDIFPNHFSARFARFGWLVAGVYFVFVMLSSTTTITEYISEMQFFLVSFVLYSSFQLGRAAFQQAPYSKLFLLGMLPLFIGAVHDIIETKNAGLGTFITHYCFGIVLYVHSLIIRMRASKRSMDVQRRMIETEVESKAKSQFLATMSHEIRTPMNGVLGMAELLEEMPLDSQAMNYVRIISSSGRDLLHLINDILDYSKIDAGKMELESVVFDVDALGYECLSVFSLNAEKKGIILTNDIDLNVHRQLIGDPTRIRQIILNLIGNALKFTETGSITLRVSELEEQSGEAQTKVKFEIIDTGIGIKQEDHTKLFETFSQADSSTTRKFGGTGLGLSISKKLSELMDGEIGVVSEVGKGSCFWFTVVVKLPPDSLVLKKEGDPAVKNRRFLLLENNLIYAGFIKKYATAWDINVDVCRNIDEAKSLVNEEGSSDYDLLIVNESFLKEGANLMGSIGLVEQNLTVAIITSLTKQVDRFEYNLPGAVHLLKLPIPVMQMQKKFNDWIMEGSTSSALPLRQKTVSALDFSGKHVLIVEDNRVNQAVITAILKKLGIHTDVVSNGEEAIDTVFNTEFNYDLVLMDCEMPVMDGYEATRQIRKIEHELELRRPVTIVALTANFGNEIEDKCLGAGMNAYLSKPINKSALYNALEHFLR